MTKRLAVPSPGQLRDNRSRAIYARVGFLAIMVLVVGLLNLGEVVAGPEERPLEYRRSTVLRLSLDDSLSIFLSQNQDLLIAKYGIETAKAKIITAGLFPNPELSLTGFSAFTQKCTFSDCRAIMPEVSQLFEVAGKRGFRVESAEFGTQSAEASFENTLRQLSFAVKDAYYRVQVARRHLEVDKKTRDRLKEFVAQMTRDPQQTGNLEDVIRLQIQQIKAEAWVINDIQDIEVAGSELRILLRLLPETDLELTTDLNYHRVDPDISNLRTHLTDNRPDIRAKRLLYSQRRSELKLANAMQYPDVTVGVGLMLQGPMGPDNQQQWIANLGVPIPVFDRNQGGIMGAAAAVQMADVALQKTLNDVQIEVNTAYQRLLHSRLLVETYGARVLEAAKSLFNMVEQAYKDGKTTNLHFLDAARTASDIQEAYLDALYNYQRNILLLESAAGQKIS